MTDLHTHILPRMDDGSHSTEESLDMLRMEAQQGVDRVLLTPHFYRDREDPESFLLRRAASYERLCTVIDELPEEERSALPQLSLGAEVLLFPGIAEWKHLRELAFSDGRYLLLELPFRPWDDEIFYQITNLIHKTDIIPVIAHLNRYFPVAGKRRIQELLEMGVPVQISAEAVTRGMHRKRAMELLQSGALLISDCHDTKRRPPNLGAAMSAIEKTLGADAAHRISMRTDRLSV